MTVDSLAVTSTPGPARPPAARTNPIPSAAIPAKAASSRPAVRFGRGRFGRVRPGSKSGVAAGSAMWVRRYPRPVDDPRARTGVVVVTQQHGGSVVGSLEFLGDRTDASVH